MQILSCFRKEFGNMYREPEECPPLSPQVTLRATLSGDGRGRDRHTPARGRMAQHLRTSTALEAGRTGRGTGVAAGPTACAVWPVTRICSPGWTR